MGDDKPRPTRVLVCGGRTYGRTTAQKITFDAEMIMIDYDFSVKTIIHGGARGADALADQFGRKSGKEVLVFKADWALYGYGAGPLRNQRMINEGKPDLVVAFPGGRGTADMVSRAKKAGIKVMEIANAG